ncbi:MAG: Glycerol kinase [Prochlorococcus marinus str. MIT 9215]|nr:MAG: Glycerol kinase [Prochlorococcus marinus str. MIT 9215]
MEGIALSVATLVTLAEKAMGKSLGELAVDGGAAASNPLLQAQANSTGLTVRRPATLESTARGVALMAGMQSGLIKNINELVPQRHEGAELFMPKMESSARERWRSRWDNAVTRSLNWGD